MTDPRTLYEKLWDSHVVAELPGGEALLYIDRQLLHEVSSPQAFVAMREAGRSLRIGAAQAPTAQPRKAQPPRERVRRVLTSPPG